MNQALCRFPFVISVLHICSSLMSLVLLSLLFYRWGYRSAKSLTYPKSHSLEEAELVFEPRSSEAALLNTRLPSTQQTLERQSVGPKVCRPIGKECKDGVGTTSLSHSHILSTGHWAAGAGGGPQILGPHAGKTTVWPTSNSCCESTDTSSPQVSREPTPEERPRNGKPVQPRAHRSPPPARHSLPLVAGLSLGRSRSWGQPGLTSVCL